MNDEFHGKKLDGFSADELAEFLAPGVPASTIRRA